MHILGLLKEYPSGPKIFFFWQWKNGHHPAKLAVSANIYAQYPQNRF